MSAARHPSALAFDALALGAVDATERATLEAHLASCERCRACVEAGAADREHFTRFVFPRTNEAISDAVAAARPSLGWARLVWLVVPALLIAAVWFGLRPPGQRAGSLLRPVAPVAPAAGPMLRDPDARLRVFALEPAAGREPPSVVRELTDGERVRRGELLRFQVSAVRVPSYAVVLVHADGSAVLLGEDDNEAARLQPGHSVELPMSYLVDEAGALARVFVFYSSERLPGAALRQMIADLHLTAAALRTTHQLALPAQLEGIALGIAAQRSLLFEAAP